MNDKERIAQLEEAIDKAWRGVGAYGNDECNFCLATLTYEEQERADGQGWDYIVHKPECIVLTLPQEDEEDAQEEEVSRNGHKQLALNWGG